MDVWKSILLKLIGFDFDVCVVVNDGDMARLLVCGVEGDFVDHICDVCSDDVQVSVWVYRGSLYLSCLVVDGDVTKVVCYASRDVGI